MVMNRGDGAHMHRWRREFKANLRIAALIVLAVGSFASLVPTQIVVRCYQSEIRIKEYLFLWHLRPVAQTRGQETEVPTDPFPLRKINDLVPGITRTQFIFKYSVNKGGDPRVLNMVNLGPLPLLNR